MTSEPAKHGQRKRRIILVLISLGIGAMGGILLCEVLLRLLGMGFAYAPTVSHPILHHVHERDFQFLSYSALNEYSNTLIYWDEHGMPADPEKKLVFDATTHTQVFAALGDSFVEANQVPYQNSFVGLLNTAAAPGVFVRNYGVSSYSPAYYLLQWRQVIRQDCPKHVLVLLYSNDIEGDADATHQARLSAAGEIEAIPGPGSGTFDKLLRKSYTLRLIRKTWLTLTWRFRHRREFAEGRVRVVGGVVEENPTVSVLTSRYLLRLAGEVRSTGATFLLAAVPSKWSLMDRKNSGREPDFADHVQAWSKSNGVEYLDLTPSFRDYSASAEGSNCPAFFAINGHFTEAGHRLVAKEIARRFPDAFRFP